MTSTALTALQYWNEHGHDDGYGHQGHHGFPFFLVAILLVAGFFIIRRRRRGSFWAGAGAGAGRSVLAERYARGEIDDAEYRTRTAVLNERPARRTKANKTG